ncbi:MAG: LytR/AlgR family response regulator transcription factor [Flavipsychrobacter sp.]
MISAIAIDDEPLALDVIKVFCNKIDFIKLEQTFTQIGEAVKYLENHKPDLLFLDIRMPAMSGIDFYKRIAPGTMAIFATAHSEYALEGFNLSAIDYLLKPFDFNRFKQAVDKANEYHTYIQNKEQVSEPYLFIRADYSVIKVATADIEYIEGLDNYLKIHLYNTKPIVARMSMKSMEEKLSPRDFMRVHRSYIIPIKNVVLLRNKTIYLKNAEIPVGTNYAEKVQQKFS